MFEHHTKTKGDLGVLKAKLDLFEKGFLILNPETEHAPFDIVIYKDGVFRRVQVKYKSLNSKGTLEITFRSNYSTSNGVRTKAVDKSEIDVYAIYCPDTDKCYYLNPKDYNQTVALRVNTSRNNQQVNIKLADDFREVP